jgi:hypothetical protein
VNAPHISIEALRRTRRTSGTQVCVCLAHIVGFLFIMHVCVSILRTRVPFRCRHTFGNL